MERSGDSTNGSTLHFRMKGLAPGAADHVPTLRLPHNGSAGLGGKGLERRLHRKPKRRWNDATCHGEVALRMQPDH